MAHEDTTGVRSALSKAYGNGGFKLSLTGTARAFVLCSKLQALTAAATGSYSAALSSIRLAAQSQWISQQHTRAVFMTFGLFVPSTNYFFVATLLVECFSTVSEQLLAVAPRFSAMSRVAWRRPPTCDLCGF